MTTLTQKRIGEKRFPSVYTKNFGPIAEGSVELRPFTVFVGPSNTGKSYLAVLIYALHEFFSGTRTEFFAGTPMRRTRSLPLPGFGDDAPTQKQIQEVIKWIESLDSPSSLGTRRTGELDIPVAVASTIWPPIDDFLTSTARLSLAVERALGVSDMGDLVRYGSGRPLELKIDLGDGSDSVIDQFEYQAETSSWLSSLSGVNSEHSLPTLTLSREEAMALGGNVRHRGPLRHSDDFLVAMTLHEIEESIINKLVGDFREPAHYLPADRTGIMHAHLIAVASVIRSATYTGLRAERTMPQLSGVIGDFLTQLVTLPNQVQRDPAVARSLAKDLEAKILDGEIDINESMTGYPEFRYHPQGWDRPLPLMNTSSMVSELAPVVLYLRHVVDPGELLIIEEPESHLHPAMQVEFVRQLATAMTKGVKILITTHSEWVLEELANLVRLSALGANDRSAINHTGPALDSEDVGVWLFEPKKRPKGSIIREIQFDPELGGYISDYEDVAIDTHNTWARISNRIEALQQE